MSLAPLTPGAVETPAQRDARFGRMMGAAQLYLQRVASPFASELTPEGALRSIVASQPSIRAALDGALSSANEFAESAFTDYREGRYDDAFRKANLLLTHAVQLDGLLTSAVPASLGIWQQLPVSMARNAIRDVATFRPSLPQPPSFPWFKVGVFGIGAFGVYWLVKSKSDAD